MKLRFTIRDLLWLTVAVSLSVSWVLTLVDNHRLRTNALQIPTSIHDPSIAPPWMGQ